jgi:hypothetical protein
MLYSTRYFIVKKKKAIEKRKLYDRPRIHPPAGQRGSDAVKNVQVRANKSGMNAPDASQTPARQGPAAGIPRGIRLFGFALLRQNGAAKDQLRQLVRELTFTSHSQYAI